MSEELHEHIAKAVLGKQVEEFFASDIGRYLVSRVANQRQDAINGLRDCHVSDVAEMLKHQNQLRQAEYFCDWLGEAIQEGLHSIELIETATQEG